ncbi:protein kinase domain-containing protein [Dictyobacter formicarum]|uniref:Protein kinase domain-containing protein n=1 Tax=Dictyobacter formicarum TaxID=2778368 RepID=A0ABQ3VIW1_9CHLR|nr:protein kinase [Dictyobacter formicarum]GHO85553.1 hypothetical protein KSZ_35590 [Dictyobacter formicarum]
MRNLERLTVETGRVIQRRYLLQRLVQQGQTCTVYQGFDQVLQRVVAIKSAAVEHIPAYRAAIRATAQFAHPNIIDIYDLIVEPDALYIVQEYVDGDDFGTLLQSQLSPYHVVDLGVQVCQALMYAGTPVRKVCHGDLTPSAIIRDRRGSVRVNNFALPGDMLYFSAWNNIGGGGPVFADPELAAGQASDGRRADDTRAVGLLLYQLLAGRNPDARTVEPPADGRLRFVRNVPPEVCELVARTIVRQHPQYIATPEALHAELKVLAEALEPPAPPVSSGQLAPAYQVADDAAVRVPQSQFAPARSGRLLSQPLGGAREASHSDADYAPHSDAGHTVMVDQNELPTAFDTSMSSKLAVARQAAYETNAPPKHVNMPLLILFGLLLFALFFGVGYYLSTVLIH